MKKLAALLIFGCLSSSVFSQKLIKDAHWKVDEVKEFNGHKIKRISGENNGVNITAVSYQSQADLIKEAKENPRLEGEKEKKKIADYKKYAQGGLVLLYIEREARDNANTGNYSLSVKTKDGKEIIKKKFKESSARRSSNNSSWYNTAHGYIGKKIKPPFVIEVEEQLPGGKSEVYVFEVVE